MIVLRLLLPTLLVMNIGLPARGNNIPPAFSWDTVGGMVFMQVCNPNSTVAHPWDSKTLDILAKYPMVALEKCMSIYEPPPLYMEDTVDALCGALKKRNPKLSCIYYLNSELDFTAYRLHKEFRKLPGYWLRNKTGDVVKQGGPNFGCKNHSCPDLLVPAYNKQDAGEFFLSSCLNMTLSPNVDGCNIDRANHIVCDNSHCEDAWGLTPTDCKAFGTNKLAALQTLQKQLGDGPLILNCHGCLKPSTVVPGVKSQNVEFFNADEKSIQALQTLAKAGKLAKAHFQDNKGCTDDFTDGLATFLIGAGENAFFACQAGWTEGPWLSWHEIYDKPLGKPKSDAIKKGDVYHRTFASGTHVTFNVTSKKGTISWAHLP